MSGKPIARSSGKYRQPTLRSKDVEIDPTATGSPIRYALGIEAALNILGGAAMTLFPNYFIKKLAASPSDITPSILALTQQCGAIVFALATPLLLAIPNTRRGIESRQSTYYLLGVGEIAMVSTFLYQALVHGDASGLSQNALLGACAGLSPLCLWRAYVLFRKPEWLGRYRDSTKED